MERGPSDGCLNFNNGAPPLPPLLYKLVAAQKMVHDVLAPRTTLPSTTVSTTLQPTTIAEQPQVKTVAQSGQAAAVAQGGRVEAVAQCGPTGQQKQGSMPTESGSNPLPSPTMLNLMCSSPATQQDQPKPVQPPPTPAPSTVEDDKVAAPGATVPPMGGTPPPEMDNNAVMAAAAAEEDKENVPAVAQGGQAAATVQGRRVEAVARSGPTGQQQQVERAQAGQAEMDNNSVNGQKQPKSAAVAEGPNPAADQGQQPAGEGPDQQPGQATEPSEGEKVVKAKPADVRAPKAEKEVIKAKPAGPRGKKRVANPKEATKTAFDAGAHTTYTQEEDDDPLAVLADAASMVRKYPRASAQEAILRIRAGHGSAPAATPVSRPRDRPGLQDVLHTALPPLVLKLGPRKLKQTTKKLPPLKRRKMSAESDSDAADPQAAFPASRSPSPPLPDGEFEIERIVGYRQATARRPPQFLVKWRGFGPAHNEWRTERQLKNAGRLLADFKKKMAVEDKKNKKPPAVKKSKAMQVQSPDGSEAGEEEEDAGEQMEDVGANEDGDEQMPAEADDASADAALGPPPVTVVPSTLVFETPGAIQTIQLEIANDSDKRMAIKIKSSDDPNFRVFPALFMMEPRSKQIIQIARLVCPAKMDLLEIISAKASEDFGTGPGQIEAVFMAIVKEKQTVCQVPISVLPAAGQPPILPAPVQPPVPELPAPAQPPVAHLPAPAEPHIPEQPANAAQPPVPAKPPPNKWTVRRTNERKRQAARRAAAAEAAALHVLQQAVAVAAAVAQQVDGGEAAAAVAQHVDGGDGP